MIAQCVTCFSTFLLLQNSTKGLLLLTEPYATIRESSGIGEVEVAGCLGPGANVSNGVYRQKTCADKEAKLL